MPTNIYCTYLTVYTGNKLPPFYLGSTSVDNINKGYRGSVSSEKYMAIWKQELHSHPDLFKTSILTRHETRQEAQDKEIIFHESLSVARNPLYINMAHANGKFFTSGPLSPERIAKTAAANTGKKRTPEQNSRQSAAKKGKKLGPQSPEHIAKCVAANTGKKLSPETKAKMSAAKTGKTLSPEHKANLVAARTGKKHTPERIAARTGKKRGPYKKKS